MAHKKEASASTVGGIYLALQDQYATSANITTWGSNRVAVVSSGSAIANSFVTTGSDLRDGFNVTWFDPIDTIIAAANQISLRAAITLTNQTTLFSCATCTQPEINSPNLTTVNRTTSQQSSAIIVNSFNAYQTDIAWLISGCAIIALACVAVAPMYWGWWNLERKFTLNPLETAKAFDAPLLRRAADDVLPVDWPEFVQATFVKYSSDTPCPEEMEENTQRPTQNDPQKTLAANIAQAAGSSTSIDISRNSIGRSQSAQHSLAMDGTDWKFRKMR